MIRLGLLDFDTSHAVEFTKRLNHRDIAEEQWVEGARIVIACPGESKIAPESITKNIPIIEKMEVKLTDKPGDMIGKVDGMLIESVDGSVHYERARPFLEAGIPCYIDKPFTCSLADAQKIAELAEKKKLPVFSSSSLRYAPELVDFIKEAKLGKIIGAMSYGPASLHERNPGLYHYGIHPLEVLYTLMGPGCERVTCTLEKDAEVSTGRWKDGRIASIRGIRSGATAYGAVVFGEKGVTTLSIGTKFIYRELLKQVVSMFTTGKAPLEISTTIEIMGFIEAALKSGRNHGAGEKVG